MKENIFICEYLKMIYGIAGKINKLDKYKK